MSEQEPADQQPVLRVVRGNPDDAEIAALTAVLSGLAQQSTTATTEHAPLSVWANRATLLRRLPAPGPGTWRASALPLPQRPPN